MYKNWIQYASLSLATAAVATAAVADMSAGRSFPLIAPLSPPSGAPDGAADDNVVLFQPHDGSFESGFTFVTDEEVEFVQFFRFPSENGRLLAFEACFSSYLASVPNFQYQFRYYSASTFGEEAEPGTLRESVNSPFFTVEAGVPTCGIIQFVVDPSDPGIDVREFATYLGVEWSVKDFPTILIAVDTNGPTSTNGWGRIDDLNPEWRPLRFTPPFTAYRNLGIRTVWAGATPDSGEPEFDSAPIPGTELTFGNVEVGASSTPETVEVTNRGGGNLTLSCSLSGADGDQFDISTCPTPVGIINPVNVTVTCQPSSGGAKSASLDITTNDADEMNVSWPLRCTGQVVDEEIVFEDGFEDP